MLTPKLEKIEQIFDTLVARAEAPRPSREYYTSEEGKFDAGGFDKAVRAYEANPLYDKVQGTLTKALEDVGGDKAAAKELYEGRLKEIKAHFMQGAINGAPDDKAEAKQATVIGLLMDRQWWNALVAAVRSLPVVGQAIEAGWKMVRSGFKLGPIEAWEQADIAKSFGGAAYNIGVDKDGLSMQGMDSYFDKGFKPEKRPADPYNLTVEARQPQAEAPAQAQENTRQINASGVAQERNDHPQVANANPKQQAADQVALKIDHFFDEKMGRNGEKMYEMFESLVTDTADKKPGAPNKPLEAFREMLNDPKNADVKKEYFATMAKAAQEMKSALVMGAKSNPNDPFQGAADAFFNLEPIKEQLQQLPPGEVAKNKANLINSLKKELGEGAAPAKAGPDKSASTQTPRFQVEEVSSTLLPQHGISFNNPKITLGNKKVSGPTV